MMVDLGLPWSSNTRMRDEIDTNKIFTCPKRDKETNATDGGARGILSGRRGY